MGIVSISSFYFLFSLSKSIPLDNKVCTQRCHKQLPLNYGSGFVSRMSKFYRILRGALPLQPVLLSGELCSVLSSWKDNPTTHLSWSSNRCPPHQQSATEGHGGAPGRHWREAPQLTPCHSGFSLQTAQLGVTKAAWWADFLPEVLFWLLFLPEASNSPSKFSTADLSQLQKVCGIS